MSIHRRPDGLRRVPMIAKHRGSVAFQIILAIAEAGEAQAFAMRAGARRLLDESYFTHDRTQERDGSADFPEKKAGFPKPDRILRMTSHPKRNGSRQVGIHRGRISDKKPPSVKSPTRRSEVRPEYLLYGKLCASSRDYPSAQIIHTVAERMLAEAHLASASPFHGGQ